MIMNPFHDPYVLTTIAIAVAMIIIAGRIP